MFCSLLLTFVVAASQGYAQVPKCDSSETAKPTRMTSADKPAQFPGGQGALMTYLDEHLILPPIDSTSMLAGKVIIQFKVLEDGQVSDACIVRSVNEILDGMVYKAVMDMPKWIPAQSNGRPNATLFRLPVSIN